VRALSYGRQAAYTERIAKQLKALGYWAFEPGERLPASMDHSEPREDNYTTAPRTQTQYDGYHVAIA
jgi:hypothetical protein